MIIFKEVTSLQQHLNILKSKGKTTGFVPTMGALHEGHLSLIRSSQLNCDITICSIFINPTQFNDAADFEKYPVTTARDIQLLVNEETDILFLPPVEEIYPRGTSPATHYELGYLENLLEGAHRPGHFQGVCQVVHRLMDIVKPDKLFLGQKDFQQCMVLKKLLELVASPATIVIGETLRETSGLAMSSRNLRLTPLQKQQATIIHQTLQQIKKDIGLHTFGELQQAATRTLLDNGFHKVDYVAIANSTTLELQDEQLKWNGQTPLVALIAAFIGEVRLIDNMLLS